MRHEVIRDIIAMHVISAQLFVLVKCSSGLTSMVREIDAWYVLGDLMQGLHKPVDAGRVSKDDGEAQFHRVLGYSIFCPWLAELWYSTKL